MGGPSPTSPKTPFPSPTLAEEILQAIPTLIVVLNGEGNAIYISPSIEVILGFQVEEALGDRYFEVICSPDTQSRTALREELSRAAKGEIPPPLVHQNCLLTKSGERRWLLWHDAKGPSDLLISAGRDITSLRIAEEEVEKREKDFRAIYERSSEGILILNENWEYEDANPAACLIFGLDKNQIVGEKHGTLLKSVLIVSEVRANALTAGTYVGETEFVRPDNERRHVEFSVVANFREGHHLMMMRDITERRSLERQLDQAHKLEAVGQLAGGVAHDFNNMLTAIRGYGELLLKIVPDGKHRKYVDGILGAAERAAQTTRQLLAFSRRQVLQPKLLDINESVRSTLDLLHHVIGEDIELLTLLSPDAGKVVVDPGQLSQLLMNLAVNSRDAMPGGGKLIIETRSVYLDDDYVVKHIQVRPGEYTMLAVTDTGTGIPEEVREHMFEPFFTTKPLGQGTGLGLAMVYGIVKQSGGYIWVYSEPGEGTTFKIYLPKSGDETREIRPAPQATRTILVIEDDELIRDLTVTVLREQGHTVLEAEDGIKALSKCESFQGELDLVITDITAPGMSGEDLMGYFAVKYPRVVIIHMSGFPRSHVASSNKALYQAHFLAKPFTVTQLLETVKRALENKQPPIPN